MKFESDSEKAFEDFFPFWHLCTPGELQSIIFRDNDDYVFGMNLIALVTGFYRDCMKLYTFQIMSNHLHFVVSGEADMVDSFFCDIKKRLQRYLSMKYSISNLKGFSHKLFAVDSLKYLRNVIAYVNRNGYLVDRNSTPFSYKWGANGYYFNPLVSNESKMYVSDIPVAIQRKLFRCRDVSVPNDYYLSGGYVSPLCYCSILEGELFFKHGNHYFNLVSRQIEGFADISKEIGDSVTFTDEELFYAAVSLSRKKFNAGSLNELNKDDKFELARILHYDYNASNKQIRRILRLDDFVVNSLFPISGRNSL